MLEQCVKIVVTGMAAMAFMVVLAVCAVQIRDALIWECHTDIECELEAARKGMAPE